MSLDQFPLSLLHSVKPRHRSLPQSSLPSPCAAARCATKPRAAAHGGGFVSSESVYVAASAATANTILDPTSEPSEMSWPSSASSTTCGGEPTCALCGPCSRPATASSL